MSIAKEKEKWVGWIEFKKTSPESNENQGTSSKVLEINAESSKRKVYSYECLH